MSIDNRSAPAGTEAPPINKGEELGPPATAVTKSGHPLQWFWLTFNLGHVPGRKGSTLLRHAIVGLIAFFLVTAVSANLGSFDNYLLATIFAYLCAIGGLTVLIGQTGQLSLGHGAIMAVGAYGLAFTQQSFEDKGMENQGWTIFVSLGVGVVAATLVGLIVGLVAARLRGPYLAGLTLALALVVPDITSYFTEKFNGDQGIAIYIPDKPASLGPAFMQYNWLTWVTGGFAIITFLFLANLTRSRVGRNFRAVRDDEIAARLSGVNVARTQVLAFVVSAAAAGLSGGLIAMLQQNAQPGAFGFQVSLYLFLAIVLGGLGSLTGAIWGAIAITLLPELTKNIGQLFNTSPELTGRLNGNASQVLFGTALVVIMIVAPGGVQGLLYRVRRWSSARFNRGARH